MTEQEMIEQGMELSDFDYVPEPGDIVTASYDALAAIVSEHQFRCFIWDTDDDAYEPLLIDAFTANVMVRMHDALSESNQAKFARMVAADRGSFARLVDFTWSHVG